MEREGSQSTSVLNVGKEGGRRRDSFEHRVTLLRVGESWLLALFRSLVPRRITALVQNENSEGF